MPENIAEIEIINEMGFTYLFIEKLSKKEIKLRPKVVLAAMAII